jgi:hypothetical protein
MRPFARPGYKWELELKEKNEIARRNGVFSAVVMNLRVQQSEEILKQMSDSQTLRAVLYGADSYSQTLFRLH